MSRHIVWQEWSPLAFKQAADTHRAVLLSIVTAWSDECASMDRTTYSHPGVVALVEERFVPVRVDGDRRPDLNDRYNLGGWPTTAFLTSAGDVLSGGTYFDASSLIAMLGQVADAYRDRAAELTARSSKLHGGVTVRSVRLQPDPTNHFRSLLIERFDRTNGGFGSFAKLPHPYALLFALSFAGSGDSELRHIVEFTLERMSALWDSTSGGFFRYADSADWSHPGTEKTLEDNAALLHVYVEAALQLRGERYREQAGAIVRWVRTVMTDRDEAGFFNGSSSRTIDRTKYVDKNAMMVGALLRAAALFDDVWLRDLALNTFETVVVPSYKPGDGVGHVSSPSGEVRGLLTDQIHVATALIWAHAATGQLPYSMLAVEVLQFAARTMWDDRSGRFRDRVDSDDPLLPFELNCHAACAFDRLAVLTGDSAHQNRAQTILNSLSDAYAERDLFAAPYAVAIREVLERHPPAGLELSAVDWKLG
jgi:uncharacterized protein